MKANFRTKDASVQHLVEQFTAIALVQHDASRKYQIARYNRLYDQMMEVENELKSREGDQRRALLPLLASRDIHVRLKAALALLAVAPDSARTVLESIRDFGLLPYSLDATMMLGSLDDGTYIPD